VNAEQDRQAARRVLARDIALFRFGLIQEALDAGLTAKQRGRLIRAVAAGEHRGPFGGQVRVSRANLDRWIRAYRTGGFTALVPTPRRVTSTTPADVLELAVALKKEAPGRTAAQIATILTARAGWAPSARTLQRHLAALGFSRVRGDGSPPATFGRFEAERPNARWVGDALHGPFVAGRKAILIAFLDDHSRAVVAARWGYSENAVALRETLRVALSSRGKPAQIYVDNGAMFIDSALKRTCAVLGVKLTHSRPGRPQGRGKIERYFRTVRDQFLVEITDQIAGTGTPVASLAELNSLFTAWVEQVYHQRVHSETGQTPLQRLLAAGPPAPTPADLLAEAFQWGEWRVVTATAQVNLHGNLYDVDPSLAGTRVELVFNPFDLTDIDVRAHSRSYGKATPSQIRRHVHPKAEADTPPPPAPTGIDYLRLIQDQHTRSLDNQLRYAHLEESTPDSPERVPFDNPPAATTAAEGRADSGGEQMDSSQDRFGPLPDIDGHHYDTDLVTLAAVAAPAPDGSDPARRTDPALEAELASFAALATHQPATRSSHTRGDGSGGSHDVRATS
jgi:putative transposase